MTSETHSWVDHKQYGTGFCRVLDEEKMYDIVKSGQGTCIHENSKKCAELMAKYTGDIKMLAVLIEPKQDVIQLLKQDKYLRHFMVYNSKQDKIIDVSNHRIRIMDKKAWVIENNIKTYTMLTFTEAKKIEADNYEVRCTLEDAIGGWCNSIHKQFDTIEKKHVNYGTYKSRRGSAMLGRRRRGKVYLSCNKGVGQRIC